MHREQSRIQPIPSMVRRPVAKAVSAAQISASSGGGSPPMRRYVSAGAGIDRAFSAAASRRSDVVPASCSSSRIGRRSAARFAALARRFRFAVAVPKARSSCAWDRLARGRPGGSRQDRPRHGVGGHRRVQPFPAQGEEVTHHARYARFWEEWRVRPLGLKDLGADNLGKHWDRSCARVPAGARAILPKFLPSMS